MNVKQQRDIADRCDDVVRAIVEALGGELADSPAAPKVQAVREESGEAAADVHVACLLGGLARFCKKSAEAIVGVSMNNDPHGTLRAVRSNREGESRD